MPLTWQLLGDYDTVDYRLGASIAEDSRLSDVQFAYRCRYSNGHDAGLEDRWIDSEDVLIFHQLYKALYALGDPFQQK